MAGQRPHGGSLRGLIMVGIVATAAPAETQSKCAKLQLLAAGQAARRQATCAARAAETGAPIDQACLDAATEKLRRKWGRAVARGDCPTAASTGDGAVLVDSFRAALVDVVLPAAASHCCDTGSACYAGPSIDASTCAFELLGTLGPPGSMCDGAGDCVVPPATAGSCCDLEFAVCVTGSTVDASTCGTVDGVFHPSAVCEPTGACIP